MSTDKKLSSAELEQLMLLRRRQEAVEGLRLLLPLSADPQPAEVPSVRTGLNRPPARPARPARAVLPHPTPAIPVAAETTTTIEEWFRQPRVRLKPVLPQKRTRRRPIRPWVAALRKVLDRLVDVLIVLVLLLFVLALGFFLYENYLGPFLRRSAGPAEAGISVSWPNQGRISAPREAAVAPLPFVPYSSTVMLAEPYVPVPTPAPGTDMPTRLVIPAVQMDTPVVEVTIENGVWQVAQFAAGYHRGTARPGMPGNTVISGHKGLAGAVFYDLDDVKVGDEVLLYAGPRLFRYVVTEKRSVWPHEVEVMAQTATPILTLITCTTYDTQRLVVIARFDREITTGASAGP